MSTRPHSPSLHRLTFVSARNQDLVAEYLAPNRATTSFTLVGRSCDFTL
jgi:hypothetical protein